MRRLFLGRKGQSITEYAILIGIVIAAVLAMQTYVKKGLEARIKVATDDINEGRELLYQPATSLSTNIVEAREGTRRITYDASGATIEKTGAGSTVLEDETTTPFTPLEAEE